MSSIRKLASTFILVMLILNQAGLAQSKINYTAIYSGVPWFDTDKNIVNAHGANIINDNGRYYLYGEAHSDTSNAFNGFSCYSSADLINWKFEGLALQVQKDGRLGPNRVGERVKVMKCPQTGEYVMLMHTDTLGYRNPCIGYATSATATGPYIFRGPLLFNGKPIQKWDMCAFQDYDGSGYLLVHGGNIFKLSTDYKSITEQVLKDMSPDCESPAVFKKGNLYYWLASSRTSWERNDNFYYTASSLKGPWVFRENFAPKGTLTWDSQTTFVLPVAGTKDTTYLFMGDRWSFPRQGSAATYVWQPINFSGNEISIPKYAEAWSVNIKTGSVTQKKTSGAIVLNTDKRIIYSGVWNQVNVSARGSAVNGASLSFQFKGTQIGIYTAAFPQGGYASVYVKNSKGQPVLTAIIDTYCKYPVQTLQFITPILVKDAYTLTVTVLGQHATWSDKRKSDYGSTGNMVAIDKFVIDGE